jgi:hypothetical protein
VFIDPGSVALKAQDEVRNLPVVTNLTARQKAVKVISVRVTEAGDAIKVIAGPQRSAA